jgi:hypothetical protein
MLDKDKLILIVQVGIKDKLRNEGHQFVPLVYEYLRRFFDESVIIICIPDPTSEQVVPSELNTSNFTTEELTRILNEANKLLREFKS